MLAQTNISLDLLAMAMLLLGARVAGTETALFNLSRGQLYEMRHSAHRSPAGARADALPPPRAQHAAAGEPGDLRRLRRPGRGGDAGPGAARVARVGTGRLRSARWWC